MSTNFYNPYVREELYHHGILGMKWGKVQGPPYPLEKSEHTALEKQMGWQRSLDGKGTGTTTREILAKSKNSKVSSVKNASSKKTSSLASNKKSTSTSSSKKKYENASSKTTTKIKAGGTKSGDTKSSSKKTEQQNPETGETIKLVDNGELDLSLGTESSKKSSSKSKSSSSKSSKKTASKVSSASNKTPKEAASKASKDKAKKVTEDLMKRGVGQVEDPRKYNKFIRDLYEKEQADKKKNKDSSSTTKSY